MIATQHPGGCVSPELEFLLLPISLASLLLTTLAFPPVPDLDQLLTASDRISPSSHPQFFLSCLFLLVLSLAQLKCHFLQSLSQLLNLRQALFSYFKALSLSDTGRGPSTPLSTDSFSKA